MVARLTPDQKVACLIHVGFNSPFFIGQKDFLLLIIIIFKFPFIFAEGFWTGYLDYRSQHA
ncbi:hypothetical protein Patl1_28771 [Pistacia atlantica]|uniref:Uncharacterized protein n=1 Tax=Pistacia atlantica TaxID=434234 RepID=A0ACC1BD81_9ROSI|nr:hypothetical protein Patl1_28771 [Pistacia atlantica]